jgi:hypothetical protein
MTPKTKKLRFWATILLVISILLNVAPVAIYTVIGFVEADLVVEKIALTSTIFIVIIMTLVAIVNKTTMRSRIWVIILGLYACLDMFITPLIIIAVCQVVDEWLANPIYKSCRNRYIINKEIDKR